MSLLKIKPRDQEERETSMPYNDHQYSKIHGDNNEKNSSQTLYKKFYYSNLLNRLRAPEKTAASFWKTKSKHKKLRSNLEERQTYLNHTPAKKHFNNFLNNWKQSGMMDTNPSLE